MALLLGSAALTLVAGCQKEAGPAESAGKEMDKAAEQVGQKIESAGEKIQDTASGDKK